MHADRTNRVVLILLGVLLIAVGAAAGAASLGIYGHHLQHATLPDNLVGRYVGTHGTWLWPVTAVAVAVLVLLALRWLAALLFSTDRSGDLTIAPASSHGPGGGGSGDTVLLARALTGAVLAEIEGYHGVSSARARLLGDPADPRLAVTALLTENADFAALRQRIESEAIAHARQALGTSLPTRLDLTITGRRSARVR
jgi:hypothetical protein